MMFRCDSGGGASGLHWIRVYTANLPVMRLSERNHTKGRAKDQFSAHCIITIQVSVHERAKGKRMLLKALIWSPMVGCPCQHGDVVRTSRTMMAFLAVETMGRINLSFSQYNVPTH
jgi:hypothetical protein